MPTIQLPKLIPCPGCGYMVFVQVREGVSIYYNGDTTVSHTCHRGMQRKISLDELNNAIDFLAYIGALDSPFFTRSTAGQWCAANMTPGSRFVLWKQEV